MSNIEDITLALGAVRMSREVAAAAALSNKKVT